MLILKIRQVADVEFNGIEKVHEGAFINRYNLTYTTKDNKKKVYEMIELVKVEDKLINSYSAIGFSNETNVVVIGKAKGRFAPSSSTLEEIQAAWYTRQQIRELLKNQPFAARSQAYCYMWSKQK